MTWQIIDVYVENDTELLWPIDQVQFMAKIEQDNDVNDHISAVYTETILNCRDRSDRVPNKIKTR